jgi:hypothetical protein
LFPAKYLGFEVKPNYDGKNETEKNAINKMVNKFQMTRSQVDSTADLKAIGTWPIKK